MSMATVAFVAQYAALLLYPQLLPVRLKYMSQTDEVFNSGEDPKADVLRCTSRLAHGVLVPTNSVQTETTLALWSFDH